MQRGGKGKRKCLNENRGVINIYTSTRLILIGFLIIANKDAHCALIWMWKFFQKKIYIVYKVRLNSNLLNLYIKLFNYCDTYPCECMCASSCLIFDESVYLEELENGKYFN